MAIVKVYLKYDSDQLMSSENKKGPFTAVDRNTTTSAVAGDKIEWVCAKKSHLKSILIVKKAGSDDVFSENPKPFPSGNKKCWIGTTESGIEQEESENYTIGYKPKGGELTFIDPKIKLKPGGGS